MLPVRLSPDTFSDSRPHELNRRLQSTPTTANIGRGEGKRGGGGGGETQLADWAINDEAEAGGRKDGEEEEEGGGGGDIFFKPASAEAAD